MLDAGRAPTAASLAALSIEESGKVSILRQLATSTTAEAVAAAWKSYRSHTRKNVQWLLPELAAKGARKLEEFRPLFEEGAEHPVVLDHVKQLGFYTDCLGSCHWSIPVEVVDTPLAKSLVQIAKLFLRKEEASVAEIELWVKHVGSASEGDLGAMKQAVIDWYAAMQEAGLRQSGINKMERFIHEGVPMPEV